MKKNRISYKKGISLFETLIVIAIFAVLGVLATRIVVLSLRGANKSGSLVKVRENLDYAISIMERHIRNAESVSNCLQPSPTPTSQISYKDEDGLVGAFSCQDLGQEGYVASASARLTGETVGVTSCSFVCSPETSTNPPSVTIELTGIDNSTNGIEKSTVSVSTQIFLRTY
jgi:type II secretory pathway pseudopilin PulG